MGNATDTMTRFLKSFLRLSVALIVLVGLSAGTALAQDTYYVDPNDSGQGSANDPGDPYEFLGGTQGALSAATSGDVIALRVGVDHPGAAEVTADLEFTSWDGNDPASTGTNAEGAAVLDGNLTVGDPTTASFNTLTLADGLTLEFEENRVLTLAGEDGGSGSAIVGGGDLLASTASGTFTIDIQQDGSNPGPGNTITATIANLVVDKPSGGSVNIDRTPFANDPGVNAELRITENLSPGFGAQGDNTAAKLDIQGGTVSLNRNALKYQAGTGVAGSKQDPFPTLNVNSSATLQASGPQFLVLDVKGDFEFVAEGTGTVNMLLRQVNAPVNPGTSVPGEGGNTINFSEISAGGESEVLDDTLRAPNLTDVTGSISIEQSGTTFLAPVLETIESDLDVLTGANATFGSNLTVGSDTRLDGSGDVVFEGTSEFGGEFVAAAGKTIDFENAATFIGATDISGGATTLNFLDPGVAVPSDEPQSIISGDLTFDDGEIDLGNDASGNPGGQHNLAVAGDFTYNGGTFAEDPGTRVFFTGSVGQNVLVNGPLSLKRLTVESGGSIVDQASGNNLEITDQLLLRSGVFTTNGQLDMSSATELVRVKDGDGNGQLRAGNEPVAYTGALGQDPSALTVPPRIEYRGTEDISTGDELIRPAEDSLDRQLEEFVVDMSTEEGQPVVTLNPDYTVTDRLEILGGNLSLGSASIRLEDNDDGEASTFVRGDGMLDPGPVPPEEALIFPNVAEGDIGTDGIDLEYVNEEGPVTAGIEFPANNRDPDLVRDLTVNSSQPVNLREEGTYRVNRDIQVSSGATLDFNGQTLQMNTEEGMDNDFDVINDGALAATGESSLEFLGRGEATVTGDVDGASNSPKTFTFPAVTVNKPDDDGDADTEARRVLFEMDDSANDEADGFEFEGDFTITAAQNWSSSDDDGVEFESEVTGVNAAPTDKVVDVVRVNGSFDQQGGSVLAFDNHAGTTFEVTGNFTKDAAKSSRFYAGGNGGPSPSAPGSVNAFTVGGTLEQANGTFYAIVNSSFDVGGDVVNNSPDKWPASETPGSPGFESEAFEVDGGADATATVAGSVTQDTTGKPVFDDATTDAIENPGDLLVEGFSGSDGEVSVGNRFNHVKGRTEIPDATTASIENAVSVDSGNFLANLGSTSQDQRLLTDTLSVAGTFEASTDASVQSVSGTPTNPEPGLADQIRVSDETSIQSSGQFSLEGFELRQGGDFTLLGEGDAPAESVSDTTTAGLRGLVRLVGDGDEPQTVTTDETASTYFHSLLVEAPGNVELGSNIALNTAAGGQGTLSGNAPTTLRPFGTLFLERGDIQTGEDTLTVLQPTPSSGGDLAQAVNADEESPIASPAASPVIGGTRNSHVVGTLQRAVEQESSTGGFVTDGYIYPLGTGDTYDAAVVQPPTDLGATDFVTVTITDAPDAELTPFETPAIDPSSLEEFTLDINQLSGPFWNVNFDEEPDEDLNVRTIASDLDSRADINDIKQMRIVQLDESESSWQLAGIYDFSGDPNDDFPSGPNSFISGVPNVIQEGVDFRQGTVIGLASDRSINPLGTGDAGAEIAGTVTYPTVENGSLVDGQALEGVEVEASSDDTTATATTDGSGNFTIAGLPAGDYDVEATVTDSVENVSTADALRAVRGFAGIDPFAGSFQEQVADVNGNGTVNATDALVIAQFVLGNVDGFDTGAFVTESESVTVEGGSEASIGLFAAEAGDVRLNGGESESSSATLASSTISPQTGAGAAVTQASNSSSNAGAESGKVFEVPVRIDRSAEIGAYQMALEFSPEKASFEGIKGAGQDVLTNAADGTVKVSWFDQSGKSSLDLRDGSDLVTLRFKAADDVESTTFAPEVVSGEIVGADAAPLSAGVEIQAVEIGTPTPDEFALNGNYPNPVRGQATIDMDLPSRTDVTIEVYNVLGQRVQTMERTMSAGAGQTVKIDGSEFASGQYFYRVKANFQGETTQETGRITVVK